MKIASLHLRLVGICVALAGCSHPEAARSIDAISNADGIDVDPPGALFPGVVLVTITGESAFSGLRQTFHCSGTLVSPQHVLTAVHCFDDLRDVEVLVSLGANQRTERNPGGDSPLAASGVARCALHPAAFGRPADEAVLCTGERDITVLRIPTQNDHHDLAVLTLLTALPLPWGRGATATPHLLADSAPEPAGGWVGTPVDMVGFGFTEVEDIDGIRRFVTVPIASLTWPRVDGEPAFPPQPWGEPALAMVGYEVREGMIPPGYRGTRPGDSGGPTLFVGGTAVPNRGAPVLGVHSRDQIDASLLVAENLAFVQSEMRFVSCRGERTPARFNPMAQPTNDRDADGVLDAGDVCPDVFDPCQEDGDRDGVGTRCDTCPNDPNPGAAQTGSADGDLVPDACDNCPSAANPEQEDTDYGPSGFGDGVGDACDICPAAYEEGAEAGRQRDCNADAEDALWRQECIVGGVEVCPRSSYVLGDACDPTPCGETLVGGLTSGRSIDSFDTLRVDAIAQTDVAIRAVTGLRFCRCSSVRGTDTLEEHQACIDVEVLPTSEIGGCNPIDLDAYDGPIEPPSWRWMTTAFSVVAADPGRRPTGLNIEVRTDHLPSNPSEPDEDLLARWDFERRDVPRWASAAPVGFDETIATGLLARLPGLVLTHQRPGVGGATWVEELSSHVESASLRYEIVRATSIPERIDPAFPWTMFEEICTFCEASFPRPWLGFSRGGLPKLDVAGTRLDPARLQLPPLPTPVFDASWVAAAEPVSLIPSAGLRLVVLAPGNVVVHAFVPQNGALIDVLAPNCPPGQCDPLPFSALRGSTSVGPGERSGGARVVSGTRSELYVLGGTAPTGELIHDAWAYSPQDDEWREIFGGQRLGSVLAATYDAVRRRLVVLDEVSVRERHRTVRQARLVELDPDGAGLHVLASFARVARTTRFALASDLGGDIWVAASGPLGLAHVLLELERDGDGVRPARFGVGAGRITEGDALRADPLGVTLLVEDRRLGFVARGYRYPSLLRVPRAVERCF